MKGTLILMIIFFLSMDVSAQNREHTLNYQILRTQGNVDATPTIDQCRESAHYLETGIDPTAMHGVSFVKSKLSRTILRSVFNHHEVTTGYGCLWFDFSGPVPEAKMHFSMATDFGDIKADGICTLIGYEEVEGVTLTKGSCLLDLTKNETTEMLGIESGTLVSTTIFSDGGPEIKGVTGSTWILQTWGGVVWL